MKSLNYLIRYILYQIFKFILSKNMNIDWYPLIRIYVNKIENRITFKIKIGYYPQFLTPETMKLLRSNKGKISKDEIGENVPL